MTPEPFREDVRRSKDALEQVTGEAVVGYRAPTFSIVRRTAWALDVLAELGLLYDSSIYPVRHDRYGVPDAPRAPFLARGPRHADPGAAAGDPARCWGSNLPVGGGGYFRLLPAGRDGAGPRGRCAASCRPAGGDALLPPLGVRPGAAAPAAAAPEPVPHLRGHRPQPRPARGPAGAASLRPGGRQLVAGYFTSIVRRAEMEADRPSRRRRSAMDFPITELMDEDACYAKLVAVAPPRRAGLPALPPGRPDAGPPPPPRPRARLPLRPLPPGLQRLHRHGPPRHQAAAQRTGPDRPRVRPGRPHRPAGPRAGLRPLGVARTAAPAPGRGLPESGPDAAG